MDKIPQCVDVEIINMLHLEGKHANPLAVAINSFNKTNQNVKDFYILLRENEGGILDISFSPKPVPIENILKTDDMYVIKKYSDAGVAIRFFIKGKYAVPLANAIGLFNETNQNIDNFEITLDYNNENRDDVIEIAFSPKRAPGERILGGRTSYGQEVHYYMDMQTGEMVKKLFGR
ncbi:MAG: hypothetical protein FWG26_01520 [Betaproteobacteria bacterium]|nr:hypothetical protein [Betaproteobacteria bacterium]